MRRVVAAAFRRALASLTLCFGLLTLIWTMVLARTNVLDSFPLDPKTVLPRWFVYLYSPHTSQWDYPIALGLLAAAVVAAALIYPRRRRARPAV